MKLITSKISILNGTNRAISSSEDDWSILSGGEYIKIGGDSNVFYEILDVKSFFYIKDFEVGNNNSEIIIKGNTGIDLLKGDTLDISYKEKELSHIIEIVSAGFGYKVGDILTIIGGDVSKNTRDNTTTETLFEVKQVNESGGVVSINCIKNGKYINMENGIFNVSSSNGKECRLKLEYKLLTDRQIISREITHIQQDTQNTRVLLNYPLFSGIKEGKISCQKWELFLTNNYNGDTKIETGYNVFRDFTPNLNIPLIAKNSPSQEILYKKAMEIIDFEVQEIKNRLDKLENK